MTIQTIMTLYYKQKSLDELELKFGSFQQLMIAYQS